MRRKGGGEGDGEKYGNVRLKGTLYSPETSEVGAMG
jgi:hypothetical protein